MTPRKFFTSPGLPAFTKISNPIRLPAPFPPRPGVPSEPPVPATRVRPVRTPFPILLNQPIRRKPLTVCAVAICTTQVTLGGPKYAILGISDRMLTSGDMEYEQPNHTKVSRLGKMAMSHFAGNAECCTEVTRSTIAAIGLPSGPKAIEEIARLQASNFEAYRREVAEGLYLRRYGLDMAAFVAGQSQMNPDFFLTTSRQIDSVWIGASSIVSGLDAGVPHLYTVGSFDQPETFQRQCHDATGFCAIGFGARQFESLLMASRYDTTWKVADALMLMYAAKKNAEISPGVGSLTDICVIDEVGFRLLHESVTNALESHYQRSKKAENRLRARTIRQVSHDRDVFDADGKLISRPSI